MPRDTNNQNPDSQWRAGILFISPWAIGFALFFVWPFAASLYWSFCQYDMVNPPVWIGGENYVRLLDDIQTGNGFGNAISNTIYYAVISVPASVVLGVGLALLLSVPLRGQTVYRTLVFLPSVIPIVAASVLWIWLLNPENGVINDLLSWLQLPPQNWLNQSRSAFTTEGFTLWPNGKIFGSKDALVLMSLWGVGNFVVIYLAAISDIPDSLHEAAELDGANSWRRVLHITLPMLTPVIFFNLVMGLIRSVQEFTSIYVVSEGTGEPGGSLTMISLQMFLSGFDDLELGYASAMAWVLFLLLTISTYLLFKTSSFWVHYRLTS